MKVIVSGSSKGIGRSICKVLSQGGHQVMAIARNQDLLFELEKEHENILGKAIDITNKQLLDEHLVTLLKQWGEIDVIINNAGQLINKPFLETTADEFLSQYNVNVVGAVNLIQMAYPFMKPKGHIVNISSMGGFQGSSKYPGLSAYSASKGGLAILSECLAEEFKHQSIAVNALALGAVQTEMLSSAFPGFEAPTSADAMAEYIAHFALNAHKYMNGKVIPLALANP